MSSTSEVQGSINQLVSKMNAFGVDVLWSAFVLEEYPGLPHLSYEPAPEDKVLRACQLLLEELEFYGKHVISITHLERVILCSNLRDRSGVPLDGCMDSAKPEAPMFNIAGTRSKLDTLHSTFNHEFFHLIDYHADYYHPTEWNDLFEASSEFAPSYSYKPRDYVSVYAMTSPSDDKAELYAHLVTNYRHVMDMTEHSKVLAEKVVRMKKLLNQFSKDFDDKFWERVSKRHFETGPTK